MKSYKSLLFLLAACLFAGCNDEDRFSMDVSELSDSWWEETELYVYERGSDTWTGKDNLFESSVDGICRLFLHFDSAEQVTRYVPLMTGSPRYYCTYAFVYDSDARTWTTRMETSEGLSVETTEVTRFTYSCIEFRSYSESGSTRQVFRRYAPTEKELQEFATYVDYDTYIKLEHGYFFPSENE